MTNVLSRYNWAGMFAFKNFPDSFEAGNFNQNQTTPRLDSTKTPQWVIFKIDTFTCSKLISVLSQKYSIRGLRPDGDN